MIARTGAELWHELVEVAGLQPDTDYDRDIVDQVGRALGVGWGSDLGEEIERAGKDATAVLVAVLGALQPWAQMMRDLLGLMAESGAKTTLTRLRAEVDVATASAQLELDLEQFKEAVEVYEEIAGALGAPAWSTTDFEALWALLPYPDEHEYGALRAEVRDWIEAYRPTAPETMASPELPWPPLPPPSPPASGDPDLDRALAAAWSVWEDLLNRATSSSTSRLDLQRRGREAQISEDGPLDGDPILAWLAQADTDHFFASVAAGLDEIGRRVREGDWSPWGSWNPKHEPQDLIDLVERISPAGREAELVRRVEELLGLPVWKHRYDLYSNWIFTRIVAALRESVEVRVEHTEGRIDFGFATAKMATCDALDLAVYCELRSPLVGPSDKRREGVQPDYSILIGDPADPAESSVVEVECKQYKTASRENFVAALQDYARSRPRARVVLTSYGPVSERVRDGILARVDETVRGRCQVIGEMRPPGAAEGADRPYREFAAFVQEGVGI